MRVEKRARLRQFLLTLIDSMKETGGEEKELVSVLYEAVDGLDSLDLGQVDPIFRPVQAGFWYESPAAIRKLRAHAVGWTKWLHAAGLKVAEAEDAVAEAYATSPENIRQWKKELNLKKTKHEGLREILQVYSTTVKAGQPASLEAALSNLATIGDQYRSLTQKMKSKKQNNGSK